MSLLVSEIFASIQGESSRAGLPCVFIRLAGCNLDCRWCDTPYARDGGREQSIGSILSSVKKWPIPLVEITGGEPLNQKKCPDLAASLQTEGYEVLVETNGSLPISRLPEGVIRIMDIKCPDSGMSASFDHNNIQALHPSDELKFVLASRRDYDYSLEMIRNHGLEKKCHHLFFSPVISSLPPSVLAEWILTDLPPVRLHLQLHPVIWPGIDRGV
ncbi:MAG: radical SAM protein [Candidatus Hydrogenedens sp.]|jgi:7-carboxy-7-deazaguanine synthase|nr:radical SAM protein [Candidatus Hydrogenedens sp.]